MYTIGMDEKQTAQFKEQLLAEQVRIEQQLKDVGVKDPVTGEWDIATAENPPVTADKNEMADKFEDLQERASTEQALETRLHNVKKALKKIEDGTYGISEITGKEIPLERLEANPAATTEAEYAE
tara:strand:+ start:1123 stop:1497 length:375 start_codon:yes stop_codon:yes gene_type:complete